jgi:hypothetical protein
LVELIGDRTVDLLNAIQALSQFSYSPHLLPANRNVPNAVSAASQRIGEAGNDRFDTRPALKRHFAVRWSNTP